MDRNRFYLDADGIKLDYKCIENNAFCRSEWNLSFAPDGHHNDDKQDEEGVETWNTKVMYVYCYFLCLDDDGYCSPDSEFEWRLNGYHLIFFIIAHSSI